MCSLVHFHFPPTGFIGDKLGYRVILIVYILTSGAAATAFHFVPRCGEHRLQPHALLYNRDHPFMTSARTAPPKRSEEGDPKLDLMCL